ncbi:MAG: heavy-metal-associated domain-containing protein [Methanospirillum sp.]
MEGGAPAGAASYCSPGTSAPEAPVTTAADGTSPAGLETATFRIEGLGCACEGAIVEKRVRALRGMATYILNPIMNQMKVSYDPAAVSIGEIVTAVKKAGASAVLVARR